MPSHVSNIHAPECNAGAGVYLVINTGAVTLGEKQGFNLTKLR